MIAALFALAAAMVIGGAAAVVQGFPYVRLESGLAMVIGGSVAASSGTVLLGLGVVALGLRRVERAARALTASAPAPLPVPLPAPAAEGRPRLAPVLPPVPSFLANPAAEPPAEGARTRIEPVLGASDPESAPEAVPAVTVPPSARPAAEPELPMPGLDPAAEHPPQPEPDARPVPGIAPEDDLFAAPEAPAAQERLPLAAVERADVERQDIERQDIERPDEAPALRTSLDAPEPEPAPEAAPERTVVGRYSSGGNTYVMYADGAIEADTPRGRFTFASLEELKAFVEGGGEGARGAA